MTMTQITLTSSGYWAELAEIFSGNDRLIQLFRGIVHAHLTDTIPSSLGEHEKQLLAQNRVLIRIDQNTFEVAIFVPHNPGTHRTFGFLRKHYPSGQSHSVGQTILEERDSLLYLNGSMVQVAHADAIARAFGYQYAEQVVRAMQDLKVMISVGGTPVRTTSTNWLRKPPGTKAERPSCDACGEHGDQCVCGALDC